jgi:hypothetical protein
MDHFEIGQRVRITESESEINGKTGIVVRERYGDSHGFWLKMDEDLPENLRTYDPPDERCNQIVMYPWECEPAEPVEPA